MKDKRCRWTRGKVLGGSSVLNTMLYIRGNRRDFDQWASFGNPGWSYEEVLPYFRKSEDQRNPYLARNKRYHGTGGLWTVQDAPYNTPLGPAFLQAGEEMGYDIVDVNGEQQTGFAFYQFNMRRGSRCSTAKSFLRPARLLMKRLVNINTALRYAITEDGPLTSSVGLEAVAFINTKYANSSDDWPDINFMLTSASVMSDGGSQVKTAHGLTDEFYNEVYGEINNRDVFGVFPMMLRPKSRGNIKLASKNPLRYPLLYHNYLTHPDDVNVLREGVKAAVAFGETQAMKKFGARFWAKKLPNCRHLPHFTDDYWNCAIRQYTMTIYHMSGTTKMGPPSDPWAVVDPQLRVYGIPGLRVIDASIMPTITNGNIHAPVVMIAEKGADMVKELWLGSAQFRTKRSGDDESEICNITEISTLTPERNSYTKGIS
uniref:Glucose-methanol-choline oxidoreductase N-terminal domain-containing protein n=1 Tax=Glossina brevipalpis TaxID=37001 RepID=A0A1A9VZA3_9MUSC